VLANLPLSFLRFDPPPSELEEEPIPRPCSFEELILRTLVKEYPPEDAVASPPSADSDPD
jgi:hypothetical protein